MTKYKKSLMHGVFPLFLLVSLGLGSLGLEIESVRGKNLITVEKEKVRNDLKKFHIKKCIRSDGTYLRVLTKLINVNCKTTLN